MKDSLYDIGAARSRIVSTARRTPVIDSPWLGDHIGAPITLKLEPFQRTGSFKFRGAASKITALTADERARGVVACSSGNHGLATATVAADHGISATICVPTWVDPVKLAAMRELGTRVVLEGDNMESAELEALRIERDDGRVFVHPFDDPDVIAGQGTLGLELAEQVDAVEQVLVPLSGGGLIAGVGLALQEVLPEARLVGVSAAAAPVMARSVAAGKLVELPEPPTVASALAGNLGPANHHTLRLVSELVDDFVEVSDEEIKIAMRGLYREHRVVVEGGGAVGVAAILAGRLEEPRRTVVVLSGGNIDLGVFAGILDGD